VKAGFLPETSIESEFQEDAMFVSALRFEKSEKIFSK